LRATNAHVSIVAHITAEELQKTVGGSVEVVNGFANRFLWTLVRSTRSLPHGGDMTVLDQFTKPLALAIEKAKTYTLITRSKEADRIWENSYESLKNAKCKATERGRPMVMRIAMIYALIDGNPIIQPSHLLAALAVWRYCEESAMRLFSNVATTPISLEKRICEIITDRPGIMRTDLRNAISHKLKADELDKAIALLVSWSDIVIVPVWENGRQADRYYPTGQQGNRGIRALGSSTVDTPNATNAPNAPVKTEDITGGGKPTAPTAPNAHCPDKKQEAATLSELIDWRNANSVDFIRKADGMIWVTTSSTIPPTIEAAILANQETLKMFIKPVEPSPAASSITPTVEPIAILDDPKRILSDEEFMREIADM